MKKEVFIAGAAGFIGIRVCEIMADAGYSVHAMVLPGESTDVIDGYISSRLEADLLASEDLERIEKYIEEKEVPFLVSLVGGVDYRQDYEASRRVNVSTAEALTSIAVKLSQKGILKKMVFGGSVAARGFLPGKGGKGHLVDESTDDYQKGLAVYCDVKREAEEVILQAIEKDKLPACIIQPGSLVGPEREGRTTTTVSLIRRALKGVPVLAGGASYTSVGAIAEGVRAALEKGAVGETWLLGGENMTMKDFALLARRLAGEHFPRLKISSFPLLTISPLLASLLGRLGAAMNRQQALLGSSFHHIDSSKAVRELGYRHSPEVLEEMIRAVLAELESQMA